jgi:AcrR family transcriptional regulator
MSTATRPRPKGATSQTAPNTKRFSDRRDAYISAAIPLVNRHGVSGLSLNEVAAALEQSPKAVAYYFKKKEDLAAACLLRGIEHIHAFIKATDQGSTAAVRARLFLKAYFDHHRRAALGEVEELTSPNDIRGFNDNVTSSAYSDMFRDLRKLLFDESDAESRQERNAKTSLFLGHCHWANYWLPSLLTERYQAAGEDIASLILDGIAVPGSKWEPKVIPCQFPSCPNDGETGEEIFLRAATELINEKGYHGASVDRISARLGLTKGAFYHHIENKDDLIVACFQRSLQIIRHTIPTAENASTTGLQILTTFANALVLPQVSGQGSLLKMGAITTLPDTMWPPLLKTYEQIIAAIASIVSKGIADGSIRPVDSNLAAQVIFGMINSADEVPYFSRDLSGERAIDWFVRPCFEGLIPS